MKKIQLLLLVYIVLFKNHAAAETVVFAVGEWPPYIQSDINNKGVVSSVLIKAFRELDIEVDVKFKPWKRVELEVNSGKSISYGWIKNREREDKWIYSDKLYSGKAVFAFVNNKGHGLDSTMLDLSTLADKVIGVTRGYSYGEVFDEQSKKLNIQIASTDLQNIGMLMRGRIDIFVVDYEVGKWILDKKFSADERGRVQFYLESPVSEYTFHAVCSKEFPQCESYINKINSGLKKLRDAENTH